MVAKSGIEIRDPLHVFVRVETPEKPVLDCRAFQRLRHIHQLALTYYLYPGATHRRFEHSLGVMELATRIFDVVTDPENIAEFPEVRDLVPTTPYELAGSRRTLRIAALCHDLGHLPFSHAAEDELLPGDEDHETLTAAIIRSNEMRSIWEEMRVDPEWIVRLAVEPQDAGDLGPWDAVLNSIITGEVFGADRMDYLLRDSLHAGVAYGRFDHYRLIDTLRILPAAPEGGDDTDDASSRDGEPQLGIETGGLQSAEALLLARYFMFSQVYLHRVRRIYDIHLKDFLVDWLPNGRFSTELDAHLKMTDNEVTAALTRAASDPEEAGHRHAARIVERRPFKVLYEPRADELKRNAAGPKQVYAAAVEEFGHDAVRYDRYSKGGGDTSFPVLGRDRQIQASSSLSEVLGSIPLASTHYVYVDPERQAEISNWMDANFDELTAPRAEDDDEDDTGELEVTR